MKRSQDLCGEQIKKAKQDSDLPVEEEETRKTSVAETTEIQGQPKEQIKNKAVTLLQDDEIPFDSDDDSLCYSALNDSQRDNHSEVIEMNVGASTSRENEFKSTDMQQEQRETSSKKQAVLSGKEKRESETPWEEEKNLPEEENFQKLFKEALNIFCSKMVDIDQNLIRKATSDIIDKFTKKAFQEINFNSTEYLIAYFNKYSTLNASVARNRFMLAFKECSKVKTSIIRRVEHKKRLEIVSLGGGPGTDMIGFLSAMRSFVKETPFLNVIVTDKWRRLESFYNIIQFLIQEETFGNISYIYKTYNVFSSFKQIDIFKTNFQNLQTADIVLLVRVLDIMDTQDKLVLNDIADAMTKGALLFIVDRTPTYVYNNEKPNNFKNVKIQNVTTLYTNDPTEYKLKLRDSNMLFDVESASKSNCNIVVFRKK